MPGRNEVEEHHHTFATSALEERRWPDSLFAESSCHLLNALCTDSQLLRHDVYM